MDDSNFFSNPHFLSVMGLVFVIIILQFRTFSKNKKRINRLGSIFSSFQFLRTVKAYIPEDQFTALEPREIFDSIECFKNPTVEEEGKYAQTNDQTYVQLFRRGKDRWVPKDAAEIFKKAGWEEEPNNKKKAWVEVTLIERTSGTHPVLGQILLSLNTYLIRNKGSVSDFHLVKDIVDRHCDAVDEEINNTLSFPLYLGLMGTMMGIIFSVGYLVFTNAFQAFLNPQANPDGDYTVISILMGGVGLAMISSFSGLGFTMYNSVKKYKEAKTQLEEEKNKFFTFIQTELLPVLTQNAASSLHRLESNLQDFNKNFALNNNYFNQTLLKIHDSFEGHAEMIKELKDVDLKSITRFNSKVLKELRESVTEFEKFNAYFNNVNAYLGLVNTLVESSDKLNQKLNFQLDRTKTIEEVAIKLNENTRLNKEVIDYMNAHLQDLRGRTDVFSASITESDDRLRQTINDLGSSLQMANVSFFEQVQQLMEGQKENSLTLVKDLFDHTSESVKKIKGIQLDQLEAVDKNKNLFEKLNYLEKLPDGFNSLAEGLKRQEALLRSLNENFSKINQVEEKREKKRTTTWQERVEKWVKLTFYISGAIIGSAVIVWQIILFIKSIF